MIHNCFPKSMTTRNAFVLPMRLGLCTRLSWTKLTKLEHKKEMDKTVKGTVRCLYDILGEFCRLLYETGISIQDMYFYVCQH